MSKPEPMACGVCGHVADWEPDPEDGEFPWNLDSEWWHTPEHDYICGKSCWLKAAGYHD